MPTTLAVSSTSSSVALTELGSSNEVVIANDGPNDAMILLGASGVVATTVSARLKAGNIAKFGCNTLANFVAAITAVVGQTAALRISSPW